MWQGQLRSQRPLLGQFHPSRSLAPLVACTDVRQGGIVSPTVFAVSTLRLEFVAMGLEVGGGRHRFGVEGVVKVRAGGTKAVPHESNQRNESSAEE